MVISPLIALMEDQFAKLRELGFAVECIHSGRIAPPHGRSRSTI